MPDGTTVPLEIKNRMEAMGYNVSMQLVCSHNYGVPQNRYRVLIIGADKSIESFEFSTMDNVVKELCIPSVCQNTQEKLLLGYVLQGVENKSDNDFWAYSTTTQKMIDQIGSCEHGKMLLNSLKSFQ